MLVPTKSDKELRALKSELKGLKSSMSAQEADLQDAQEELERMRSEMREKDKALRKESREMESLRDQITSLQVRRCGTINRYAARIYSLYPGHRKRIRSSERRMRISWQRLVFTDSKLKISARGRKLRRRRSRSRLSSRSWRRNLRRWNPSRRSRGKSELPALKVMHPPKRSHL